MSKAKYAYVGVVTLLLICCIVAMIVWKNSWLGRMKSYEMVAEFQSISGLLVNAVVKYRGYTIGRVKQIIPGQKKIDVVFFVNNNYKIPRGSIVKITFDGLVGERFMEIVPNVSATQFYANGDVIPGETSSGLADFIDVGTKNLEELRVIISTLATVFGNQDISVALKELVYSLQETAENMEKIVQEISGIKASKKIDRILNQTEHFLTTVNSSLSEDDYKRIHSILKNIEAFSIGLKEITEDGKIKESVISTLDETRSTFQTSRTLLETVTKIRLITSLSLDKYMGPKDLMVYNINFDFRLDDAWLGFGFSNFSETDQLMNILFNLPLDADTYLRLGLFKLKPGLGITYIFPNTSLMLKLSLYRIENPFLDLSLHYKIYDRFMLNLGYDELNHSSRIGFFGVSYFGK
jgi:phospholipid/cholesterol/gamma-HCH transport system substrate-binding protein